MEKLIEMHELIPVYRRKHVYRFDQLDERAKDTVRDAFRAEYGDNRNDDYPFDFSMEEASMQAMADAMNATLEWERDSYDNWHVTFTPDFPNPEAEDLTGARAMAYIENRFLTPNEKPTTLWCGKKRRRIATVFDLTGYYLDGCMTDAYQQWKEEYRRRANARTDLPDVADYITTLESNLEHCFTADDEYHASDEYLDEEIESYWGDHYYLADGTDVTDDIVDAAG